jgi:hypothetical protein
MATLDHMVHYLQHHNIEIVSADRFGFVVVALYCIEGVAIEVEETIEPTWQAVRKWLGY